MGSVQLETILLTELSSVEETFRVLKNMVSPGTALAGLVLKDAGEGRAGET